MRQEATEKYCNLVTSPKVGQEVRWDR